MEATLERQARVQGLNIPETASVIGLGGTGFWTALFLAMSGCKHLILVDDDKIESSNLNRLPINSSQVGLFKTDCVYTWLRQHSPTMPDRVETYRWKINKEEDCQVLRGHIFCCTDTLKSQRLICAYAKKNGFKYQRVGYDGTVLNVSKQFPLTFDESQEDNGGYTVTPSWVVPAVVAAALGVSSSCYKEICLMDDLSKLNMLGKYIPEGLWEPLGKRYADEYAEVYLEEGRDQVIDNISEYIPDNYGYCISCPTTQEHYEHGYEKGYEEGEEGGYTQGYQDVIDEILNSNMGQELLDAVDEYVQSNYPERSNSDD